MPSILLVDDDPNICFLERMVLRSAVGGFTVVGQVIVLFTAQHDAATEAAASALGVRACLPKTDLRRLPAHLLGSVP
jgi:hypothetical protein